jgi:hypothetical protein
MTAYEFNYITSDMLLFSKTTFIQNGQEVKWNERQFLKN